MIKTFLGWDEQQLADGTLIVTTPGGQTYVTTPGSALLFPSLCRSVGGFAAPEVDPPMDHCSERSAMMPRRRRTRAQDRAYRIVTERRHNREARQARTTRPADYWTYGGPAPPPDEDDPPPF